MNRISSREMGERSENAILCECNSLIIKANKKMRISGYLLGFRKPSNRKASFPFLPQL